MPKVEETLRRQVRKWQQASQLFGMNVSLFSITPIGKRPQIAIEEIDGTAVVMSRSKEHNATP